MTWDVDPVLVDLGFAQIRWYGACFATAVVLGATALTNYAKSRDLEAENSLTLAVLAGLVLGAHFGHILFYEPESIWEDPKRLIQLGLGLASHGGVLGAVIGIWIWARRKGRAVHPYLDCAAMSAMWMIPFIRLGNFFNSEIVGTRTDLPWGIVFARRGETFARHPAQLYEAVVGILMIGLTFWLQRKRDRFKPGFDFYLIVCLYMVARFLIEFTKEYQVLEHGLTMGHWLSIPAIAICLVGMRWAQRQ